MKRPVYAWCFKSSSSGKLYQTIRYTDSSLSCDCPGWTRRVAPDGSRTCKHVRSVLIGTANYESVKYGALTRKDLPASHPIIEHKTTKLPAPTEFKTFKRKLNV